MLLLLFKKILHDFGYTWQRIDDNSIIWGEKT